MFPTEGTKSLLSSYLSFPHPSAQQALTEGKALTVFSRSKQQGREEKAKLFLLKTASMEDMIPAGLTT